MDFEFKVDAEVKREFLGNKPTATARSNGFILKLADEYEEIASKRIYNMTYAELKDLIAVQFKNYRLAMFTRKEAREFVSKQAIEYRYISREDLRKYQNILINEQDVAILEVVYNGIRGRTEEGATLEELINLQIDEKSSNFKNNVLE